MMEKLDVSEEIVAVEQLFTISFCMYELEECKVSGLNTLRKDRNNLNRLYQIKNM